MSDHPPSDHDIVRLIRSYVAHRRRQQPSADLEERAIARAVAGRGARLRRALATGLVSLAAAAAIIVGFAAVHSQLTGSTAPRPSTSGPVATPTPLTPYPGKPTPNVPLPTLPPPATVVCTLGDLQVVGWGSFYSVADEGESVEFTNTTSTACYMAGPPEIQFTLSSGEVEAVPPGPLATETIDIEPGTAAILVFGSTSVCPSSDPPVTATSATITLGGDPVTLTQSMDLGCGAPAVGYFAANGTGGVPPSDAVSGVISPAS